MPFTPSPAPTAEQKAILRGILSLDTHAEVLEAVSDFETQEEASAEWALTLTDLTSYDALYSDSGDLKRVGDIEFFENKNSTQLLNIVNRIRARYGIAELTTLLPSVTIQSTLAWF
jgi:hypothetical protein